MPNISFTNNNSQLHRTDTPTKIRATFILSRELEECDISMQIKRHSATEISDVTLTTCVRYECTDSL